MLLNIIVSKIQKYVIYLINLLVAEMENRSLWNCKKNIFIFYENICFRISQSVPLAIYDMARYY